MATSDEPFRACAYVVEGVVFAVVVAREVEEEAGLVEEAALGAAVARDEVVAFGEEPFAQDGIEGRG